MRGVVDPGLGVVDAATAARSLCLFLNLRAKTKSSRHARPRANRHYCVAGESAAVEVFDEAGRGWALLSAATRSGRVELRAAPSNR